MEARGDLGWAGGGRGRQASLGRNQTPSRAGKRCLRTKPRARGRGGSESPSRVSQVGPRPHSAGRLQGQNRMDPSRGLRGLFCSDADTRVRAVGVCGDRPLGKRRVRGERSGPRPEVGREENEREKPETEPRAPRPTPSAPSPPTHRPPLLSSRARAPHSPSPRLRLLLGPTPRSERLFRFRLRPPPVAAPPLA